MVKSFSISFLVFEFLNLFSKVKTARITKNLLLQKFQNLNWQQLLDLQAEVSADNDRLKTLSDLLTAREKIVGETYVQSLI